MLKIVIASDSFKGCLSSSDVAMAAEGGIKTILPDAEIVKIEVADGGEGTTRAIGRHINSQTVTCDTIDARGRNISSDYAIYSSGSDKIAIIDVSSASSLTLVADLTPDIMHASSYGTGMMIVDAMNRGCRKFYIALGGSATCDAGIGILAALGCEFYDNNNTLLSPIPLNLNRIRRIGYSAIHPAVKDSEFNLLCDVNNPLYGLNGAAFIFAPQKGANHEEVEFLDDGLRNIAGLFNQTTPVRIETIPGAGAAGGMGVALAAVANVRFLNGAETLLNLIDFDSIIANADLVITGEGSIDSQTLCGKIPFAVSQRANKAHVPCVAIAGKVSDETVLIKSGFSAVFSTTLRPMPLSDAMTPAIARESISAVAGAIASLMFGNAL